VRAKKLVPVVDRVLPLSQAREAFRMLDERRVFGKVALVP
jgi:NADPH:quinone reductase-like Zn-dependent oxidoreductase